MASARCSGDPEKQSYPGNSKVAKVFQRAATATLDSLRISLGLLIYSLYHQHGIIFNPNDGGSVTGNLEAFAMSDPEKAKEPCKTFLEILQKEIRKEVSIMRIEKDLMVSLIAHDIAKMIYEMVEEPEKVEKDS